MNVLTLSAGALGAQILNILSIPISARLYEPTAFGELGVYTTILGALSVLVCGQYESAIVLPRKKASALNLLVLCHILLLSTTALFSVLLFLSVTFIPSAGQHLSGSISFYVLLLPIHLLFFGSGEAISYWRLREKRFRLLTTAQLIKAAVQIAFQIAFPQLGWFGNRGLIIAQFLGQLFFWLLLILGDTPQTWRHQRGLCLRQSLEQITIQHLVYEAKRYVKYPAFVTWSSLLDKIRFTISVLAINNWFGLNNAGFYFLTVKILQLPSALLGSSISKVLYRKLSDDMTHHRLVAKTMRRMFQYLVLLAIPVLLVIVPLGPFVFRMFLGEQWVASGQIARFMVLSAAAQFVSVPLSMVFGVLNRQELLAAWKVLAFVSTATVAAICAFGQGGFDLFYRAISVNDLIIYSVYAFIALYISGVNFRKLFSYMSQSD
ncbi:MAG: oligosaccharide flippase family protein [Cyanobacteria bacterium J06650_10]